MSEIQALCYVLWFLGFLFGMGNLINIAFDTRYTAIEKLGFGVTTVGMAVLYFFLVYDLPNMPIMKGWV